jgi:hypothetical protein
MAPVWAPAKATAPIKKDKRMAPAANPEPIALRNKRDTFKVSSRRLHPYILLNPEVAEKLHPGFSKFGEFERFTKLDAD